MGGSTVYIVQMMVHCAGGGGGAVLHVDGSPPQRREG